MARAVREGKTKALDNLRGQGQTSQLAGSRQCTGDKRALGHSQCSIGDVAFEQTVAVELSEHPVAQHPVAQHPVAQGLLKLVPVGGREVGGLVELDRALGPSPNTPSMTPRRPL